MGKSILVLTGSPRKGGNSDLLADAFIKGARAAGHDVTKYGTAFKEIGGCRACDRCYSKGKACVFDDDFNELAPLIEQSDVMVFATPLYWFTFPAQLKAALDKMYAFTGGKRPGVPKEGLLLSVAETSVLSDFDGLVKAYELSLAYMKWKDLGHLLVPSVPAVGDILRTDALERAEALGRSIT